MSYCFNFACPHPENAGDDRFCLKCGKSLLLGDQFRAVKLIGQGGFGRTLLAIGQSTEDQAQCVIKQLLPGSKQSVELFRQEAERLKQFGQHPQIPALLAHFEQEDALYLVQEFIDGQTLEEVLAAEGTFSETQIRSLLGEILPVLRFIHQHQIIHRDIKPSNIIRPRQKENAPPQKLFLVDFGASKLSADDRLKQTGTVIGSAGYAAPEQIGRAHV